MTVSFIPCCVRAPVPWAAPGWTARPSCPRESARARFAGSPVCAARSRHLAEMLDKAFTAPQRAEDRFPLPYGGLDELPAFLPVDEAGRVAQVEARDRGRLRESAAGTRSAGPTSTARIVALRSCPRRTSSHQVKDTGLLVTVMATSVMSSKASSRSESRSLSVRALRRPRRCQRPLCRVFFHQSKAPIFPSGGAQFARRS